MNIKTIMRDRKNSVPHSVSLPNDLSKKLQDYAEKNHLTKSKVMELALIKFLKK